MKKILALVISLIMLISALGSIEVAAVNKAGDKDYLFLDDYDKVHKVYSFPDNVDYYYDEIYYHHVNEDDQNSEIDWAIIYALAYATNERTLKTVVADRIIVEQHDVQYGLGWALYDAETKEFTALNKVDSTKYKGFAKGLEEANIGNPLGDADLDGGLTVLDATYIQRAIAERCDFKESDDLSSYDIWGKEYENPLKYISDIDGDGERTILDATTIQFKLAGLEQ